MASIIPSAVPAESNNSVPSSSATRRASLHRVIIPSAQMLAHIATPTVTGGHGHPAEVLPSPDAIMSTLDTPGHGHPAKETFFALPFAHHSPATMTHLRLSAQAMRMNNPFSASNVGDAQAPQSGAMTPPLEEDEASLRTDEDGRSESAESSRAGSAVEASDDSQDVPSISFSMA